MTVKKGKTVTGGKAPVNRVIPTDEKTVAPTKLERGKTPPPKVIPKDKG
jgi:hypothetical protein